MTTTQAERATANLSALVAEEIRAMMGRRQVSGARIARELDVSEMWISTRLRGKQPIDLNDLERIADVLGVPVIDLLPTAVRERGSVTGKYPRLPERLTQFADRLTERAQRPADNRPKSRPRAAALAGLRRTALLPRAAAPIAA